MKNLAQKRVKLKVNKIIVIIKRKLIEFHKPLNIFFSIILAVFIILSFTISNIMPFLLLTFTFSNFIFLAIYIKPFKKLEKDFKEGNFFLQLAFIVTGLIMIIGILLAVFFSDSRYYLNNPNTKHYNYLMCTLVSLLLLFHISVEQSLFITLRERRKSFPFVLSVVLIGLLVILGLIVILTEGFTVSYFLLKYFVYTGYILLTLYPRYTMLKFLFSEKRSILNNN